jgi:2-phosphosulfolactate phosphatase
VLLGAVVNAAAVARRLRALAPAARRGCVCAGTDGRVSLDDVVGAACVLHALVASVPDLDLDDARHSRCGRSRVRARPTRWSGAPRTLGTLERIGFADDVAFAARRDAFDVVPERGPEPGSAFAVRHRGTAAR